MTTQLRNLSEYLIETLNQIDSERKTILESIAMSISDQIRSQGASKLIFICTHNSRRSQFAQVWTEFASSLFDLDQVQSFSGGTEATAVSENVIDSLDRFGFEHVKEVEGSNPFYRVELSPQRSFHLFSKKYEHPENPQNGFIAVMVCSDADRGCPMVFGCSERFSLPFDDPKEFDNTEIVGEMYDKRSMEIGREILYIMSKVNNDK